MRTLVKVGDKVLVKRELFVRTVTRIHAFPDLWDGYKLAGVTVYYLDDEPGYVERDDFLTKQELDAMFAE